MSNLNIKANKQQEETLLAAPSIVMSTCEGGKKHLNMKEKANLEAVLELSATKQQLIQL